MLYVNRNIAVATSDTDTTTLDLWRDAGDVVECRGDWDSFVQVQTIANDLNVAAGSLSYIAVDNGDNNWPRYDVNKLVQVGDPVSYSFNGDSYPDGIVTGMSPTFKVISTSTGNRYYRVRETGCWRRSGTWNLIRGHHRTQNPSF